MAAIQLAKLIGLRVVAVADAVRHGARLSDLGVDFIVDRQDPYRAIEIIRNVTKGNLRFGLDAVGKETATHLQESLQRSKGDRQAHIVGLTGLPKTKLPGIKYHSVPIKVFHSAPALGNQTMDWLEGLLVEKILLPPEVAIADGGLGGINGALDRLRSGSISGKRLVVPVGAGKTKELNGDVVPNVTVGSKPFANDLSYADKLNTDPTRLKFA